MCGIVGFIDPAGRTPDPDAVLRRMRETLQHRGPDDAGEHIAAPAWLGHRRLSIVDLSPAGRQPFVATFGTDASEVVALANGEIYNHLALRERIARRFPTGPASGSDCAVLPWLWCLDRAELPRALRGMFGLAIWDARAGELFLARDAAGQKPVYYAHLPGGGLAFASEPKALLVHPLVGRDVDPVGLRRYLAFDCVPGEATIYRGVRRLAPGTSLLWRDGRATVSAWFDVRPGEPRFTSLRASSDALWEALVQAVEARLMADVPLGVFLSGGLDSSAVVAAMAECMDARKISTFAVGFTEPTFDESSHARRVATHFGTDHHEEILAPEHLLDLIPSVMTVLDEPFADPSIVPTWLLSRFTRHHVTVALGGDGGDELLLGYPTFFAESVARAVARVPGRARQTVLDAVVARLPVSTRHMSAEFKARRFMSGLDLPPHRRHPVWVGGLPPDLHDAALAAERRGAVSDDALFAEIDALTARFDDARPDAAPLERLAHGYFKVYLGDQVLTKVDRASMAHALEARAPFLDQRVQETAARIPVRFKLRGTRTKRVLRHALASRLPADILERPKKGFGIPVAAWLRGPLLPWLRSTLDPEKVRRGGLLDPAFTSRLVEEHASGAANHQKPLWNLLALELWRSGTWGPG
ncbi:MAG: asparagine synthase (glutamine-hydrolyzing) [Deltaproteobacteria bacterium]|nr:asparagine synthase (glutamine-hydrolyzing) [Deltaproteobacteria bacterium]MCB9786793.1 asparagine synthase (glutamine-hydrolyzing) [Deltaproteobacteria bacterium]